ncbi:MAG: hypothetical protein GY856_07370 [bacterium]|nr:hypothetical protein [bacterium]
MILAVILSISLVGVGQVPELGPGGQSAYPELVVPPLAIADGWIELTLLHSELPPSVVRLGNRKDTDDELWLEPALPEGLTMLCRGGRPYGVACEQVYLSATDPFGAQPIEVLFVPGLAVTGTYLLEGMEVEGARVAVVPAGLGIARAFTVPLEVNGHHPGREVLTDEDGRFTLPELAAGEYFLETVLPWGRVHRSDPFLLPDPESYRRELGESVDKSLTWDVGEIDVADGLAVEFRVRDFAGRPIVGAQVGGTQGRIPRDVVSFEGVTDRIGEARLSGFSVEQPVLLVCKAPGYQTFRRQYELVPVVVDCILERWAVVLGQVLNPGSEPVVGATISVRPLEEANRPPILTRTDATGRFVVDELPAGEYELTAAAPDFEAETRSFSVVPAERRELASIFLLFGQGLDGLVRDGESEAPLAGVEIRAVSPPGAVVATSDEDGEFRLAVASTQPLVLRFSTVDYASREVTVEPEEIDSGEPLVVDLVRAGWILAVVEDGDSGLPCQGCRVVIRPTGEELVTDGLGEALSGPLAEGYYRVSQARITHLGSTIIEQPEAEYRHVRVRRSWVSTARLGRKGRPLRVVFEPLPEGLWMLSARTPLRSEKHYPEADGSYLVHPRDGESLELYLHHYDPVLAAEVEIRQQTLAPNPDASEVVVKLPRTVIRGRAVGGDGAVAGERVRLRALTDGSVFAVVRTDPEGFFQIPHVSAGVYSVVIGEKGVQFLSVTDGETVDLGTYELITGGF